MESRSLPVTNPLATGSLDGLRALVTGSSRGIGAETATYLAEAGAGVVINFRNKEARATKLVDKIVAAGGSAIAIGADLTDATSVASMFDSIETDWGGLDILVMNASGGMESGMAEDYAMQLNRDAQVTLLNEAIPLLAPGSRVVFVTSHQAMIPILDAAGIGFVVVSGDMIEGTITATLLERANPGAISARKGSAGRLYNVSEFAAEIAAAAVEPIPTDHIRLVGDVSDFGTA